MPHLSDAADDPTPLTASRIDIPVRIGWLLRTYREVGGLSLRQMSAALRAREVALSASTLSRIETEGHRSPAALDGYADVLGLADGALRAPVDTVCRTFLYAPKPPPEPTTPSLDRFSRSFEAIDMDAPTGGAWLRFSREHAEERGFGLPRTLMEPHIRRLTGELGRSVGTAQNTRYEALAQLRLSTYGGIVEHVVREIAPTPAVTVWFDLMSVVTERPTPGLLDWVGGLLAHESVSVVRGASHGLQNMLVVGGLSPVEWTAWIAHFERAWRDGGDDPARRAVLSELYAALPRSLQAQIRRTCRVQPEPPPGPRDWSRSRRNVHYEYATSIARAACARVAHREEPLLARLLFEAMFDQRGARAVTSSLLVAASAFGEAMVPLLLEARDRAPDEASRRAATRVVSACHRGEVVPAAAAWLDSADLDEFGRAVGIFGRSGQRLPEAALERGLSGDEAMVRTTLYSLGLAEDPRLGTITERSALPPTVRTAARWWANQGGRILV